MTGQWKCNECGYTGTVEVPKGPWREVEPKVKREIKKQHNEVSPSCKRMRGVLLSEVGTTH